MFSDRLLVGIDERLYLRELHDKNRRDDGVGVFLPCITSAMARNVALFAIMRIAGYKSCY